MSVRDQQMLLLAALLLAHGAAAAPITRTESAPVSAGLNLSTSFTFSFAPITAADALLSISDGSVFSPEGYTFNVTVDYVGGTQQSIYNTNLVFGTFSLSSLANLSFAPGNINGLTFAETSGIAPALLTIPQGTVFTFNAAAVTVPPSVPEPPLLALLAAAGAVGILNSRRRRTKTAQDETTSE